jgi:hypothetical protein
MKRCVNHPPLDALSVCHSCGKDFCEACLQEGGEFYYCQSPGCQAMLRLEKPPELARIVVCLTCGGEIQPTPTERRSRKVHCHECETFIDFNVQPPTLFAPEQYVRLLSSFNQGDIMLIKSILDDSSTDYYLTGENFLSVEPLVQPAVFYIHQDGLDTAKELLKDFELHFFGISANNEAPD